MDLIEILTEKGIYYKNTNNPSEILVRCTSGEHEDKNPSLSYNLDKEVFKCWSCGFGGGYKKFLASIGIDTSIDIESKQPYKIRKVRNKLNKIKTHSEIKMPRSYTVANGSYRNISAATLKSFQAFFTLEYDLEDYLCFPIYQFGKLRFIEGRVRYKNSIKSKYKRQPRGVSITDVLFPLDKVENTNHIILVEGIFDMLSMWQAGFHNTLCTFGTSNFGEKKADLLDRLGTIRVDVMMDGDTAGSKAASTIYSLLEKRDIDTNIIRLPNNRDPGDLSPDELNFYLGKI